MASLTVMSTGCFELSHEEALVEPSESRSTPYVCFDTNHVETIAAVYREQARVVRCVAEWERERGHPLSAAVFDLAARLIDETARSAGVVSADREREAAIDEARVALEEAQRIEDEEREAAAEASRARAESVSEAFETAASAVQSSTTSSEQVGRAIEGYGMAVATAVVSGIDEREAKERRDELRGEVQAMHDAIADLKALHDDRTEWDGSTTVLEAAVLDALTQGVPLEECLRIIYAWSGSAEVLAFDPGLRDAVLGVASRIDAAARPQSVEERVKQSDEDAVAKALRELMERLIEVERAAGMYERWSRPFPTPAVPDEAPEAMPARPAPIHSSEETSPSGSTETEHATPSPLEPSTPPPTSDEPREHE